MRRHSRGAADRRLSGPKTWPSWLSAGLAAALTVGVVIPGSGLIVATPAGAEAASYAITAQSRTLETYAFLPYPVTQGAPSATVHLEHQAVPQCEAVAGLFDGGLVEEYIDLGSYGMYQNPTLIRAGNQRGALPEQAEFGAAPGPNAQAACPTTLSGAATATSGGHASDQLSIHSAASRSGATKLDGEGVVVSEAATKLQGITLGEVSIRQLESWVSVEWRPDQDPLVSYRMVLHGLFNGTEEVLLNGERGVVLQGQDLAGSEFVAQFNEQSKAHETAFEQLGTYGFRILEPRVYQDSAGRDVIESFVLNSGFGLAARQGEQIGNFQGMRLAASRITGRIAPFAT